MAETDLSSRDPVIASPFRTAFIQSAESFSTVPSEYILDEETIQAMLAQHTSKNVDVSYLTGVAQADEPESEENNFDDRVRPYLVSYQYFVSYPNLVNVPESHELAGSRYVVNPTRSYAFCKEDSHISAAERHDLETYWKDVIDTESSESVLDHEAWKSIVNTELQSIPGESIAKLLTRGAA
ncbi:hypothetical protein I204_02156 [Kwoniella mangroviensis CBS 8886]|nr:hypothetical protein I204_02156 [Kwoniella mangroviensis CBS 8886]